MIYQSTYLPRVIGILMGIAGLCYLTQSVALLLAPHFADAIFPAIMLPCFIAELSFSLWLILRGVDVSRWREKASALQIG